MYAHEVVYYYTTCYVKLTVPKCNFTVRICNVIFVITPPLFKNIPI